MMSDLLKMFEEAGAQFTDNNIQINFDFEDAKENFGLDLEHFCIYNETVKKSFATNCSLNPVILWEIFLNLYMVCSVS